MSTIKSSVLVRLKEKIELLVADNRELREENSKVSAQKDRLEGQNSESRARIEALEEKVRMLEIKEGFIGAADNSVAKARVTRLISEIDRCIELLQ